VGAYPIPVGKVRELVGSAREVLVLEEGYPYVERLLRGILPGPKPIRGKEDGTIPLDGELTPDSVRRALGLEIARGVSLADLVLPARPPQLCQGCPHRDAYSAVKQVLSGFDVSLVTADIGCYTLGALPPYRAIESCVCMGASIGMAKGAADAGLRPVVAVIGDSTFLHSGVTPLMDAAADDTDMTVLILDNGTVGMTGQQTTVLPSSRLLPIVQGVGVAAGHVHVVEAHPKKVDAMAEVIRREMDHRGLSVVIVVRECIQALKKHKAEPT
jgi:indolepyruvate ferredoxin oxidoreductase alpha subunit